MKYIRAEPALTLRLAKAAQEANMKKSSLLPATTTASGTSMAVEGNKASTQGNAVFTAVTPSKSSDNTGAGPGAGKVPVSSKIDWGAVVTDADTEGEVESEVVQDKSLNTTETAAEESEVVEEEEEEDCVNSTHFEEVIEVEDVFGCVSEGTERDVNRIENIEEGDEGEEDEEEEDDDEEEEEDEDEEGEEGAATSLTPTAEAKTGNIDFSESYFPTLSAVGPKRAKQWPLSTNENINRSPVINNDDIFADAVEGDDVEETVIEGESGGNSVGKVSSAVPIAWGASGGGGVGTGVPAPVSAPVKNWSQVAALSVQAAVVTASDNKHTAANR